MGKSAAIATATELLEILKRSQLVSAEQITAHEEAAQGASDAKAAARIFVKAKLLSPWQVMQLLAGRHNLRLGPYTLREQTKKGSQGAMFLAEHTQLNRLATIKILRDEHSLDAARKAFGVDHPHLLRVLDVDQKGERYYVAIEHVAGPTLQEHVANQNHSYEHETILKEEATIYFLVNTSVPISNFFNFLSLICFKVDLNI